MPRRHVVFTIVLASLLAVAVASSAALALPSGAKKRAALAPIVIGMINQENTPAGSFPENSQAAKAAVAYIDKELNGFEGHPLKLVLCTTVGTPESATTCANKLAAMKPLFITSGVDFGTVASMPILQAAGIPYIGGVPLLAPELTSPNAYFFIGGSAAAFPAEAVYLARDLKAKKVNIIYTDNAAGAAAAGVFGKNIMVTLGMDANNIKLIPEKADAADFTPSMTAANANSPDAILILFAAQGCSRAMQAKQSLGVKAKMFYPGSCADKTVLAAGGAGANGAYFNSETRLFTDTSSKEVVLYRAKLAKYGGKNPVYSNFSQDSFAAIMNTYELFKEIGYAKLNSKSLVAKLKSTVNHHNFMGFPYSCNGKRSPFPSVCNAHVRMVQYQDGKFKDVAGKWISGATLIKFG
jgi:branched-chain amino acid transport system substrate-binding protein